jgi:uncharacterized protein (TIGR02594 family)
VASPYPVPYRHARSCRRCEQPDHHGLGEEARHQGSRPWSTTPVSVPWSGLFFAACLAEDGIPAPPIAVRAKAWASWGANLAAQRLAPGAVLVFDRAGGGHVGFYVGEDLSSYHVLGGNQGDRVSIMRLERAGALRGVGRSDVP